MMYGRTISIVEINYFVERKCTIIGQDFFLAGKISATSAKYLVTLSNFLIIGKGVYRQ